MTSPAGQVSAGLVGRAHGLDGSFYVERVSEQLEPGTSVTVAGRSLQIERRAGTDDRPLVRLTGIEDRTAAEALRGERILVDGGDLEEDEYLTADLVGCDVPGLGTVRRVIPGLSCDVLEVGDAAVLVPFISDAIKQVDLTAREIQVDTEFLGIEGGSPS